MTADGTSRSTSRRRTAAAESARNRQCPECGRKSAVWRERIAGVTYYGCRWCPYRATRNSTPGG